MDAIESVLWPIALLGGAGAAIDFYIGKAGQKRVKDWLERKWYQFHEVNWHNFGENEARYYIDFADRFFGDKLISWRRLISTTAIGLSAMVIFSAASLIHPHGPSFMDLLRWFLNPNTVMWSSPWFVLVIQLFVFALSISFTRWISLRVIKLSASRLLAPVLFAGLLIVHYLLFVMWRPLSEALISLVNISASIAKDQLSSFFSGEKPIHGWDYLVETGTMILSEFWFAPNFHYLWSPRDWLRPVYGLSFFVGNDYYSWRPYAVFEKTAFVLSYLANVLRLSIALILFGAFVFREWLGRTVSTLWARVVEGDKPAFTIILGGIGGLAGVLTEVLKHF